MRNFFSVTFGFLTLFACASNPAQQPAASPELFGAAVEAKIAGGPELLVLQQQAERSEQPHAEAAMTGVDKVQVIVSGSGWAHTAAETEGVTFEFQVPDTATWPLCLDAESALAPLELTPMVRSSVTGTTISMRYHAKGSNEDLLSAAEDLRAKLPLGGDLPTEHVGTGRASFDFVIVDERTDLARAGKAVALDIGLKDRYVVLVGLVTRDSDLAAAQDMVQAVDLAAKSLAVLEVE